MTVGAYDNCYTSGNGCPTDAGDKRVKLAETDTQGIGLASNASVADIDIAITRGESTTGAKAQCDITTTGVVVQRAKTTGHVVVARCIVKKCAIAQCDVSVAHCIAEERLLANGDVVLAGHVVLEGSSAVSRVEVAGVVAQ